MEWVVAKAVALRSGRTRSEEELHRFVGAVEGR
jgi:hypothetical protein